MCAFDLNLIRSFIEITIILIILYQLYYFFKGNTGIIVSLLIIRAGNEYNAKQKLKTCRFTQMAANCLSSLRKLGPA